MGSVQKWLNPDMVYNRNDAGCLSKCRTADRTTWVRKCLFRLAAVRRTGELTTDGGHMEKDIGWVQEKFLILTWENAQNAVNVSLHVHAGRLSSARTVMIFTRAPNVSNTVCISIM